MSPGGGGAALGLDQAGCALGRAGGASVLGPARWRGGGAPSCKGQDCMCNFTCCSPLQMLNQVTCCCLPWCCCSDLPYSTIAALSSRVRAAGAGLLLLGGRDGMLSSSKPVVAVTAVRTGCGKSQVRTERGPQAQWGALTAMHTCKNGRGSVSIATHCARNQG